MPRISTLLALLAFGPTLLAQSIPDLDPGRFQGDLKRFALEDSRNPMAKGGSIFVGSSSIKRFEIERYFPGLRARNRGMGGAHISDVNHFLEELVLKHEPVKVFLYCGGNDLWRRKPVFQVYEDYLEFKRQLFSRLPNCELYILGLRPSPMREPILSQQLSLNYLFQSESETDERITYLSASCDPFIDAQGKPRMHLFHEDRVHMNDAGYDIWVEALRPIVSPFLEP
ncbi:MAG: GDSL-type esterase/lipase family protein [Verrucomicrobiota bacterium]